VRRWHGAIAPYSRSPWRSRGGNIGELALHKLNGEVLADNERSIHLHKKVGFTEEGRFREQHDDGANRIDIVRVGLLASEWPTHRERLQARIAQLERLAQQPTTPARLHQTLSSSAIDRNGGEV
jgi:hypothetical protein